MKESMHLGTRILHFPAYFAGADNITTNLAKKREPGIEIIERTPKSLIITSIIKFSVKSSTELVNKTRATFSTNEKPIQNHS